MYIYFSSLLRCKGVNLPRIITYLHVITSHVNSQKKVSTSHLHMNFAQLPIDTSVLILAGGKAFLRHQLMHICNICNTFNCTNLLNLAEKESLHISQSYHAQAASAKYAQIKWTYYYITFQIYCQYVLRSNKYNIRFSEKRELSIISRPSCLC